MTVNPFFFSADVLYKDGHLDVIPQFLGTDTVQQQLLNSGVDVTLNLQQTEMAIAGFLGGAINLFFNLFLFAALLWITGAIRIGPGGVGPGNNNPMNPFNMLKSNVEMAENVEENFDCVAGADEAK